MLIALKNDGVVYLAYNLSDLPVRDFARNDFLIPDNIPLWKVKNGCIMGCENELEDSDLLRYDARIFRGEIEVSNLLDNIVPSMLDKLSAFHRLDKDGEMKSDFVIAQGGRGYHITGNGLREELYNYFTFGTGYQLAISSLEMSAGMPPLERIKKAFEEVDASLFIPAYPIAVLDTKTQKLQIIEKP